MIVAPSGMEARGELSARRDVGLARREIDQLVERQRDYGRFERRRAPVTMIDEGHYHRDVRDAIDGRARRVLEAQAAHFAHAGDEQARIEPADHVALAFVLAGAKVAAIEDAGVGVDAAAAVAFEARRAPQGWRVTCGIVPEPLRLRELAGGFVGRPAVHFTLTSAVSPNSPTR
jgi:hypothetical protein